MLLDDSNFDCRIRLGMIYFQYLALAELGAPLSVPARLGEKQVIVNLVVMDNLEKSCGWEIYQVRFR